MNPIIYLAAFVLVAQLSICTGCDIVKKLQEAGEEEKKKHCPTEDAEIPDEFVAKVQKCYNDELHGKFPKDCDEKMADEFFNKKLINHPDLKKSCSSAVQQAIKADAMAAAQGQTLPLKKCGKAIEKECDTYMKLVDTFKGCVEA